MLTGEVTVGVPPSKSPSLLAVMGLDVDHVGAGPRVHAQGSVGGQAEDADAIVALARGYVDAGAEVAAAGAVVDDERQDGTGHGGPVAQDLRLGDGEDVAGGRRGGADAELIGARAGVD